MSNLKNDIENTYVTRGSLVMFWLGQAGFAFKTANDNVILIDPYLSDSAERLHGFRRLMPIPILPEEIVAGFVITTHEHVDHCDPDTISIIARNAKVSFIGPAECVKKFQELGVNKSHCFEIEEGTTIDFEGVIITGVYADHGRLSKDAIGVILEIDGTKVYHTGDTTYRPERMQRVMDLKPDVIIPCINGKFGNLYPTEAAKLSRDVNAKVSIASHFWMFVEHDGDPHRFIKACQKFAPNVLPVVMQLGGKYLIKEHS